MGRSVSCKLCKTKGDSDTFYRVTDEKGKRSYYCSLEEYDNFINEKVKREILIKYLAEDVLNYEEGQIVPPVMLKKIKELNGFYDHEVIHQCFIEQRENIQYWIGVKEFTNEFNKVSYIMRIIENNINDTFEKWKHKKKQQLKMENTSVDLDIMNQLDNSKVKKQSNDGISAFLDEEDL